VNQSASTSARSARSISVSPIGAMQSVGGAMIFVAWIARWIASASSRVISEGLRELAIFAAAQISSAVRPDTREKSFARQPRRFRAVVSRNICISTPSSTPYGCGRISVVSAGSSSLTLGKTCSAPCSSAFGGTYVICACGFASEIWRM